jgi:tRNA nucleotidyltransferase (CCA-adding enzyme)
MTREEIIAKIRKVEALFMGTDSPGEMQAARSALNRLKEQLAAAPEQAEEFQFSMPDPWKRQLFVALVRRHNLTPYRKYRQRQTTVMVRTTRSMVDKILWPQYLELSRLLHAYLDEATRDIISRSVHGDLSEAVEQQNLAPG